MTVEENQALVGPKDPEVVAAFDEAAKWITQAKEEENEGNLVLLGDEVLECFRVCHDLLGHLSISSGLPLTTKMDVLGYGTMKTFIYNKSARFADYVHQCTFCMQNINSKITLTSREVFRYLSGI